MASNGRASSILVPTIYEKVMKIPDNMIIKYYNLCTDIHPDEGTWV